MNSNESCSVFFAQAACTINPPDLDAAILPTTARIRRSTVGCSWYRHFLLLHLRKSTLHFYILLLEVFILLALLLFLMADCFNYCWRTDRAAIAGSTHRSNVLENLAWRMRRDGDFLPVTSAVGEAEYHRRPKGRSRLLWLCQAEWPSSG